MAVMELNLLNSQNEFSQMGEHFQEKHNLQKISPKWESALPFGRKSPKSQVERAPLLLTLFVISTTAPHRLLYFMHEI